MNIIDAQISVSTVDNVTVVNVGGELDDFQAPKLHSVLQTVSNNKTPVIIDLTHTTFVDSVGLGVIVSHAKSAKKNASALGLVVNTPQINRLIDQSGIAKSTQLELRIFSTLSNGVEGLSR